jgi:putative membrane protein
MKAKKRIMDSKVVVPSKRKLVFAALLITVTAFSLFTGCQQSPSSSGGSLPRDISEGVDSANSSSGSSDGSDAIDSPSTDSNSEDVSSPGAGLPSASGDVDVDITEKMYVAYINDIYVNTPDYIGQNIRIQGMFQSYTDENTGLTYYYVYRVGPGCCGNDGSMCGFEFTWSGDLPQNNDWIEVIGSLRTYEEDGWTYLTLDASSVTVMKERGAENVFQ